MLRRMKRARPFAVLCSSFFVLGSSFFVHGSSFGPQTTNVERRTSNGPAAKKLLFLTHAALYKHSSLAPAEKAVAELGAKNGFEVTTLEGYKQDSNAIDLSMITPAYLSQFDGLMLMTNGKVSTACASTIPGTEP